MMVRTAFGGEMQHQLSSAAAAASSAAAARSESQEDDDDLSEVDSDSDDDDDDSDSDEEEGELMMAVGGDSGDDDDTEIPQCHIPSDVELVLLCLDYVRDLRRRRRRSSSSSSKRRSSSSSEAMKNNDDDKHDDNDGLHTDYLTVACWALNKSIVQEDLQRHGNDSFTPLLLSSSRKKSPTNGGGLFAPPTTTATPNTTTTTTKPFLDLAKPPVLPSLQEMENELFGDPLESEGGQEEKKTDNDDNDVTSFFEYNDQHWSNAYRFYTLGGLASGGCGSNSCASPSATINSATSSSIAQSNLPLNLGEITAAGLAGLGSRSRLEAERDMIQSPLFLQFVQAVQTKGFFDITDQQMESAMMMMMQGDEKDQQQHDENTIQRIRDRIYEDRYRKVVAKFRTKLAKKADDQNLLMGGDEFACRAASQHRAFRLLAQQQHSISYQQRQLMASSSPILLSPSATAPLSSSNNGNTATAAGAGQTTDPPVTPASYVRRTEFAQKLFFNQDAPTPTNNKGGGGDVDSASNNNNKRPTAPAALPNSHLETVVSKVQQLQHPPVTPPVAVAAESPAAAPTLLSGVVVDTDVSQHHPDDMAKAEQYKTDGNSYMQAKDFVKAVECYTYALKLCATGPNSHVYFSNRAAAHVSMKQFNEAVIDSERSLALQPTYGKAHARLGLAHYLLGNYRQAMEAYTVALKYEPDNRSSRNYLEKSAKRYAEVSQQQQQQQQFHPTSSDSEKAADDEIMVSSNNAQQQQQQPSTTSFSVVSEWEKSRANKINRMRTPTPTSGSGAPTPANTSTPSGGGGYHFLQQSSGGAPSGTGSSDRDHSHHHQRPPSSRDIEREAEKYKARGNSYMASREYDMAMQAYTKAIQINPNGSQSHVYYSNRAAALCYVERYREAEADSLRSLDLNPTYGKAHARLGLSRFFLQDYEGAIEAYEQSLYFDPNNAASKSYLSKAKMKLQEQLAAGGGGGLKKQVPEGTSRRNNNNNKPPVRHISDDPEAAARRMMEAPEVRELAQRVMTAASMDSNGKDNNSNKNGNRRRSSRGSSTGNLLEDPELQLLAKQALMDPSLAAAVSRK